MTGITLVVPVMPCRDGRARDIACYPSYCLDTGLRAIARVVLPNVHQSYAGFEWGLDGYG